MNWVIRGRDGARGNTEHGGTVVRNQVRTEKLKIFCHVLVLK